MITGTVTHSALIPDSLRDFITYEGNSEYSGYTGIQNLFRLLKRDVKIAFKEYGISIPNQSKQLKALQSLIIPFNVYWEEWSASTFCNLTSFEVSLINLYRIKQDYKWISSRLGISYDQALTHLIKAIRSLKSPETEVLFQKWKDFKHLDPRVPENFLDMPLEGLRQLLPYRVFNLLPFFGSTMREALGKVTIKELRSYRNFGKQAELQFRLVLEKHYCLHLLK